jgi:anti-sigma B factor antagonist
MLELSIAGGDLCPVITLSGQADLTTVAPLSELLTAQLSRGMTRLMVDAAELSFADSMAVRTLVLAALTLKDRGGGLVLLHPQPPVARMLALIGADQVITVDAEPTITPAQKGSTESAF